MGISPYSVNASSLSVFSPCHCATLRKASRHVSQTYDTALAPSGIKTTQFTLLSTIDRVFKIPPTVQELARVLVMDRSTLGHNLRPLERSGLISLKEDPKDRRSVRLHLTRQGRDKLKQARVLWEDVQKRFESAFGIRQTSDLRKALLLLATTQI